MTVDGPSDASSPSTDPGTEAGAQAPSPDRRPPGRRPLEASDLHQLASITQVAVHPGGDGIVHTVSWPDPTSDTNLSELWHRPDDGPSVNLVRGLSDSAPVFSPDGSRLAFVRSLGSGAAAVLVLGWDDRRLVEAGRFGDGVGPLRWIDDHRLVVLAIGRPDDQAGVGDDELQRRARRIDRLDYRFNGRGWTHDRPNRIHLVDLDGGPGPAGATGDRTTGEAGAGGPGPTVTALADVVNEPGYDLARADHRAVAPSPDGSALAVTVSSDDDADLTGSSAVWVHPLDGGPSRRLTPGGGDWSELVWHPDGTLVAIGLPDALVHGFARPHRISLDGPAPDGPVPGAGADGPSPTIPAPVVLGPHDVNASPAVGPGGGMVAVEGGVLTCGSRRGCLTVERYRLARGERTDGAIETVAEGRFQVTAFDASTDGSLVVGAVTTTDRPAELWQLAPGPPRRLTSLNDHLLDRLDLAPVEEVEIPVDDGRSIHAFVTRPPTSARDTTGPDGTRPGLVYVHGGPMSQYGWGFFDEFQLAAADGYVVIGANPTGSDGYGEDWATAIVADLGGRDWRDVQAVTDHLAARDDVDADRIGIGGGSYGGFMAAWAIGHSDRYRAALVERAVTNWASFAGTSDIGSQFGPALLGATPESDLGSLARQSPISHLAGATTPSLILHSEQDWRCPIEQAEQLFAALRRNGCDVVLVRFPDEHHELSRSGSPRHRVERFELIHRFFDRHLLTDGHWLDGGEPADGDPVAEGNPVADDDLPLDRTEG